MSAIITDSMKMQDDSSNVSFARLHGMTIGDAPERENSGASLRQIVMKAIVWLGYFVGIDALFYFLNRKAKRTIVLHNVLPDEVMKRENTVGAVSLSSLLFIVRECRRKFSVSLDLFDPKSVTFTFDDGYLNQYEIAFRELNKIGVKGYVFWAGDVDKGLSIDRLNYWRLSAPRTLPDGTDREKYWNDVVLPAYKSDVPGRGRAAIEACEKAYSFDCVFAAMTSEHFNLRFRGISAAQIEEMRQAGWRVGWHTQSHYPLSWLSGEDLRSEIRPPKGFEGEVFSYPFGTDRMVGEAPRAVAAACGFPAAVSNTIISGDGFDLHYLPRMQFSPDRFRLHYELSGFGHFLRTRHLLPRVKEGK